MVLARAWAWLSDYTGRGRPVKLTALFASTASKDNSEYYAENPSQPGKDFPNFLGASSLECASLLARFRSRSNSARTKAAASCRTPKRQWTIVLVAAGLLSVHPCSSVVFVHTFGCGSACAVKLVASFSVYTSEVVSP